MSDSLWIPGLWPTRLLCPWEFPGKTTGVGCHCLLLGIFPRRDWTHVSCIGKWILYHRSTWEALTNDLLAANLNGLISVAITFDLFINSPHFDHFVILQKFSYIALSKIVPSRFYSCGAAPLQPLVQTSLPPSRLQDVGLGHDCIFGLVYSHFTSEITSWQPSSSSPLYEK